MTQRDPFDLEAAFDAARAAPAPLPDDLAARILADAQAHQPRKPIWQRIIAAVGGPAGVGGLVTATAAGFWFGIAPPAEGFDPLVLVGAVEQDIDADLTLMSDFGWGNDEG
ncbi:hypothetical protein [uncultured Sulfitobacter sp.]|uniref:hypothetical protein n=1 Tax=uncultured Sulfitobacter sp. TaxID=191468 RepID=UPI002619BC27|nr:hypothetical protein [uncultured Sulfitobacter sp.]